MNFRGLTPWVTALSIMLAQPAQAGIFDKLKGLLGAEEEASTISGLTQGETIEGLKQALAQGVATAITTLGQTDGFWASQEVRIPLPEELEPLVRAANRLGGERYVEDFQLSLNRAAEAAVPVAAEVFSEAIQNMTVEDAVAIVRGPDDAATQYFRSTAGEVLKEKFLPIVSEATEATGVTQSYKRLQSKAGALLALVGADEDTDLDTFVTGKALDGLFLYIAAEEQRIREDPVARSTELLQALFGNL